MCGQVFLGVVIAALVLADDSCFSVLMLGKETATKAAPMEDPMELPRYEPLQRISLLQVQQQASLQHRASPLSFFNDPPFESEDSDTPFSLVTAKATARRPETGSMLPQPGLMELGASQTSNSRVRQNENPNVPTNSWPSLTAAGSDSKVLQNESPNLPANSWLSLTAAGARAAAETDLPSLPSWSSSYQQLQQPQNKPVQLPASQDGEVDHSSMSPGALGHLSNLLRTSPLSGATMQQPQATDGSATIVSLLTAGSPRNAAIHSEKSGLEATASQGMPTAGYHADNTEYGNLVQQAREGERYKEEPHILPATHLDPAERGAYHQAVQPSMEWEHHEEEPHILPANDAKRPETAEGIAYNQAVQQAMEWEQSQKDAYTQPNNEIVTDAKRPETAEGIAYNQAVQQAQLREEPYAQSNNDIVTVANRPESAEGIPYNQAVQQAIEWEQSQRDAYTQPNNKIVTDRPRAFATHGSHVPSNEIEEELHPTYATASSDCTPKCMWSCESVKCDEVCTPECQPPRCETRCASADLSGCAMECEEPHCAVVCPERQCPSQSCSSCTSTCTDPVCKLRCPKKQPCHNVCEHPSCEWKCSAPSECPAPRCHMVCESPKNCMGSTYRSLPPLVPGEIAVQSFAAPTNDAALNQNSINVSAVTRSTSQLRSQVSSSVSEHPLLERRTMGLPLIRPTLAK